MMSTAGHVSVEQELLQAIRAICDRLVLFRFLLDICLLTRGIGFKGWILEFVGYPRWTMA